MQEIDHTANPFPGLRPFESSETHLFFGRDGQSEELLRRLKRTRFLAVVGTSGSGKSSLVRAGLLPALQGGLMASAGSDWRIAILRPGGDPIGNLARALAGPAVLGARGKNDAGMQAVMAETTLRRSSLGLVELISRARTKLDDGGQQLFRDYENLLVVVDQFEELFRFKQLIEEENSKEDAAAFVKLLLEAVGQRDEQRIYVVLTMRSDFLGDCSQFFELPEAINNGQYLIPRMTRDERREAISGPVAVGQGAISEPLVNQLLNDVGDNPDQLPILQHALMRTWDHWLGHRNGNPIDIRDYNAIGGMAEALSRHADEAYAELNDSQKLITEKLFKGLTEKGTDNREIRRPMEVQEICELTGANEAAVIAVIEVFRREGRSFLMPPPADALTGAPVQLNRESLIDISHESLIRNWERLKQWVDEESRSARIYRRLAETAVLHKEGGAGLWRDPDLGVALTWREQNSPNEVWAKRYHPEFPLAVRFLDESVAARDAQIAGEEARRRKEINRTRLTAMIFGVAFLFSLAMGIYAYGQKNSAQRSLLLAEGQTKIAEAARKETAEALKKADDKNDLIQLANRELKNSQGEVVKRIKEAEKQRNLAEAQTLLAKKSTETAKAEKKNAETQARIASAQKIGVQADLNIDRGDLERSVLLSVESLKRAFTPEGYIGWARGMDLMPRKLGSKLVQSANDVRALTFSPDGRRFAEGETSGGVTLYRTDNSAAPIKLQLQPNDSVNTIAFVHDGNWLAAAGQGHLKIWDLTACEETCRVVKSFDGFNAKSIAFSPDGRYVAMDGQPMAQVYDTTKNWSVVAQLNFDDPFQYVMSISFSPDGKWLAGGFRGGKLVIWDVADFDRGADATLKPVAMEVVKSSIFTLAFSPHGLYLASSNTQGEVDIWKVSSESDGKQLKLSKLPGEKRIRHRFPSAQPLVFSSDESYIVTNSGSDIRTSGLTTAYVWEVETFRLVGRIELGSNDISAISFSPSDDLLAISSGEVLFFSSHFGSETVRLDYGGVVHAIDLSRQGPWLVVAGTHGATVFQTADWSRVVTLGNADDIIGTVISPDGRWLAARSKGKVTVFETTHWTPMNEIKETVSFIGFSPDSRWLATVSDNLVQLFQVAPWREVPTMKHIDPVYGLSFSPDGRWLATRTAQRPRRRYTSGPFREEMFVWNIETAVPVACKTEEGVPTNETMRSAGTQGGVVCSDLREAGQQALLLEAHNWNESLESKQTSRDSLVSDDGRWQAERKDEGLALNFKEGNTSRQVAQLVPVSGVHDMAFTPDSRWLVVAEYNTVKLWPLKSADMIDAACARLRRHDLTSDEWKLFISDEKLQPTCSPQPR
jgi:WD40 repeat protein/energy-coupling factor transporter ATP-binding protein EcfA2